jgi:L-cysteine S-thiosulfotransferase
MRGLVFVLMTLSAAATAGEIAPADRRSGYEFAGPETQAMQDDDTTNPGMLWVAQGEALWGQRSGERDSHAPIAMTTRK